MSCSKTSKKLCDDDNCEMCKSKSFASHEKAIFWSKLNNLSPRKVFKNSHKLYYFDCSCGHTFDIILANANKGVWCSYCCNPQQKLCDKDDCKNCFKKSFASHEKAIYWNYEKNNYVVPRQVFNHTHTKYWFNCNICHHIFDVALYNVNMDGWCSYCNGHHKLCETDCKMCFEKSFASHEKSIYWSDDNELKSRQVHLNSNKEFIFDCYCGHKIKMILGNVNYGYWCSYCCSPRAKVCGDENCKMCFENSFASYEKAIYWNFEKNNEVKPIDVLKGSGVKYWFKCINGHHFSQGLNSTSNGSWCPYCVNKTEQKLYDTLLQHYPQLTQQFKVEWCKNKTYLPFDFVLEENKIIIELDGLQHFEQVSNWSSPEETHKNDVYKMKCANDNGYSVIRLLQEDVFYDTYDWLEELRDNIEKIKSDQRVQNVYMGKYNEYSIFS